MMEAQVGVPCVSSLGHCRHKPSCSDLVAAIEGLSWTYEPPPKDTDRALAVLKAIAEGRQTRRVKQLEAFRELELVRKAIETEGMSASKERLSGLLIEQSRAWQRLWQLAPSDELVEEIHRVARAEDGLINDGLNEAGDEE